MEKRPSKLSSLGLSAVQLLSQGGNESATGSVQEITVLFTDLIVNRVGWKVEGRYYLNNFDLNSRFTRDEHDSPVAALRKAAAQ